MSRLFPDHWGELSYQKPAEIVQAARQHPAELRYLTAGIRKIIDWAEAACSDEQSMLAYMAKYMRPAS